MEGIVRCSYWCEGRLKSLNFKISLLTYESLDLLLSWSEKPIQLYNYKQRYGIEQLGAHHDVTEHVEVKGNVDLDVVKEKLLGNKRFGVTVNGPIYPPVAVETKQVPEPDKVLVSKDLLHSLTKQIETLELSSKQLQLEYSNKVSETVVEDRLEESNNIYVKNDLYQKINELLSKTKINDIIHGYEKYTEWIGLCQDNEDEVRKILTNNNEETATIQVDDEPKNSFINDATSLSASMVPVITMNYQIKDFHVEFTLHNCGTSTPVSYTHLDVYKRQVRVHVIYDYGSISSTG